MSQKFVEILYSERAGMYLKTQFVKGRKVVDKANRNGYREKFAQQIGVDSRTLCRYSVAVHDVDTIAYLAASLGVSVGDMLSYEGEHVPLLYKSKTNKNFLLNFFWNL